METTAAIYEVIVENVGSIELAEAVALAGVKVMVIDDSNTIRRSDGVHARVLGTQGPIGAQPVAPTLEDAYLFSLSTHRAGAAA